jgi:hypothetical protein
MCSIMPKSRFAVVEDQEQVDKVLSIREQVPSARAHHL